MRLSTLIIPALSPFLRLTTSSPLHPPKTHPLHDIHSYISLGDSYASGPGSGSLTNSTCQRHTLSYPLQLASLLSSPGDPISHTHIPCMGTTSTSLLATQLPSFATAPWSTDSPPPALATLSLGGNDARFWPVIDACVYRFKWPYLSPSPPNPPSNPSGTPAFTGDCDTELLTSVSETHSTIPSALAHVYRSILSVGLAQNENFSLYVTGYPRLFNAESDQCDGVAFNYWSLDRQRQYLTRERRRRINRVITLLGMTIQDAVKQVNSERKGEGDGKGRERVVYIPIDDVFNGHRFCEPDVVEPEYARGRGGWFFNTYTAPAAGVNPTNADLEGGEGEREALGALKLGGEGWDESQSGSPDLRDGGMVGEDEDDGEEKDDEKGHGEEEVNWVPASWLRVFHPTPEGHAGIARAVMDAIQRSHSSSSSTAGGSWEGGEVGELR